MRSPMVGVRSRTSFCAFAPFRSGSSSRVGTNSRYRSGAYRAIKFLAWLWITISIATGSAESGRTERQRGSPVSALRFTGPNCRTRLLTSRTTNESPRHARNPHATHWKRLNASSKIARVAVLSKPKAVIVTADDFGLSREVNAGVIRAHREGILTGTSLMVAGAARDEAAVLAHEN